MADTRHRYYKEEPRITLGKFNICISTCLVYPNLFFEKFQAYLSFALCAHICISVSQLRAHSCISHAELKIFAKLAEKISSSGIHASFKHCELLKNIGQKKICKFHEFSKLSNIISGKQSSEARSGTHLQQRLIYQRQYIRQDKKRIFKEAARTKLLLFLHPNQQVVYPRVQATHRCIVYIIVVWRAAAVYSIYIRSRDLRGA